MPASHDVAAALPTSRSKLRLGVLGTGRIARKFVAAVQPSAKVEVVGVASRDLRQARSFADEFAIPVAYSSYDELLNDTSIQAVYNPLPIALHAAWSIKAAEAGKHVLCEKALALNAAEAALIFQAAERHGVRIVEAYPYRAQPHAAAVRDLIRDGAVGTIRLIYASFGFPMPAGGDFRLDPELGGGALLDAGSYPISLVRFLVGSAPTRVSAVSHLGSEGVDMVTAATLEHSGGIIAQVSCAFGTAVHRVALIVGDAGTVETSFANQPSATFPPSLRLRQGSGWHEETRIIDIPAVDAFLAQAEGFSDMIFGGEAQWNGATPRESIDIARTIDAILESSRTDRPVLLAREAA
jgi:predicted dehydrogenase